jgi:ABC-type spermidine/putrescine transport system permease subunit I
LTPYSNLKKFRQLIVQVEKVVSELKGEKAKALGKQVLTNLRNRIVPNTAPGVARGTMMVNTK